MSDFTGFDTGGREEDGADEDPVDDDPDEEGCGDGVAGKEPASWRELKQQQAANGEEEEEVGHELYLEICEAFYLSYALGKEWKPVPVPIPVSIKSVVEPVKNGPSPVFFRLLRLRLLTI